MEATDRDGWRGILEEAKAHLQGCGTTDDDDGGGGGGGFIKRLRAD
jgi:hypothetical protein